MSEVTLSAMHFYPLKSAAGISLAAARVDERGIAGDRRWMIVDEERVFITQRTHPRLALISVVPEDGGLVLRVPGRPPLGVSAPPADSPPIEVQVWDDVCSALPAGVEAADWLSSFVGQPVQLVYMPDDAQRITPLLRDSPVSQLGFADGFPFLLISEASLEDLNSRMRSPVPMDRFRPNLVVRGCSPYAEDGWRQIAIGGIVFHVVKPCSRCATTVVDQTTGERGREPLATLATYRRFGNQVMFGQNLIHERTGDLRVGDAVELREST